MNIFQSRVSLDSDIEILLQISLTESTPLLAEVSIQTKLAMMAT